MTRLVGTRSITTGGRRDVAAEEAEIQLQLARWGVAVGVDPLSITVKCRRCTWTVRHIGDIQEGAALTQRKLREHWRDTH